MEEHLFDSVLRSPRRGAQQMVEILEGLVLILRYAPERMTELNLDDKIGPENAAALRRVGESPQAREQVILLFETAAALLRGRHRIRPRQPKTRPLVPRRERMAREFAARDAEQTIQPLAARVAFWRQAAEQSKAEHQYQWAGFWRRVAEIQESGLRVTVEGIR